MPSFTRLTSESISLPSPRFLSKPFFCNIKINDKFKVHNYNAYFSSIVTLQCCKLAVFFLTNFINLLITVLITHCCFMTPNLNVINQLLFYRASSMDSKTPGLRQLHCIGISFHTLSRIQIIIVLVLNLKTGTSIILILFNYMIVCNTFTHKGKEIIIIYIFVYAKS